MRKHLLSDTALLRIDNEAKAKQSCQVFNLNTCIFPSVPLGFLNLSSLGYETCVGAQNIRNAVVIHSIPPIRSSAAVRSSPPLPLSVVL